MQAQHNGFDGVNIDARFLLQGLPSRMACGVQAD